METGYQRSRIQEESLYYEHRKHDGSLPIVGVNTFINPHQEALPSPSLQRSTTDEKNSQIARLRDFQKRHAEEAPTMRERLRQAVIHNDNVFEVLMEAVRVCSLGQISDTLFEVGGQYRRNM
jgi:methylmalonyl-CoA mutase